MDGYNKKSQEGRMSLEDVLELYDGQNGQNTNDNVNYRDINMDNNITIPQKSSRQEIMEKPVTTEEYRKRNPVPARRRRPSFAEASSWFQTICWINIPVLGVFYMFVMLVRKKTPVHKKNFIIGYIMYKALVWLLSITLVYWLYKTGLDFIDGMLNYIT